MAALWFVPLLWRQTTMTPLMASFSDFPAFGKWAGRGGRRENLIDFG